VRRQFETHSWMDARAAQRVDHFSHENEKLVSPLSPQPLGGHSPDDAGPGLIPGSMIGTDHRLMADARMPVLSNALNPRRCAELSAMSRAQLELV